MLAAEDEWPLSTPSHSMCQRLEHWVFLPAKTPLPFRTGERQAQEEAATPTPTFTPPRSSVADQYAESKRRQPSSKRTPPKHGRLVERSNICPLRAFGAGCSCRKCRDVRGAKDARNSQRVVLVLTRSTREDSTCQHRNMSLRAAAISTLPKDSISMW